MILIKNGYIKTMADRDIQNGCLLIGDNGKILNIAKYNEPPSTDRGSFRYRHNNRFMTGKNDINAF